MDGHATPPAAQGNHPSRVPGPSAWGIITGLTALLLAGALLWWANDQDSNFAQALFGAAIAVAALSAIGWMYDDSRHKKTLQAVAAHGGAEARYNQIVTFALADGRVESAREPGGIIHALDQSDSELRGLAGFQDLRITMSPSGSGPSQVIVETTWSGREGLASYEATRTTILDLISRHDDDVVPGSVQVFDMEVVRDTKQISFSFGLGSASTVLAGLIVGGFMVGAGLTMFEDDTAAANGGGGTTPPAGVDTDCSDGACTLVARDNKFDQTTLTGAAGKEVTLTFENKGKVQHNVHFMTAAGGPDLAPGAFGEIIPTGTVVVKFTPAAAGSFFYQCDLHPTQMTGSFQVN